MTEARLQMLVAMGSYMAPVLRIDTYRNWLFGIFADNSSGT